MALGLGTMASKTRPESGVVLRDEPSRGDDGIISAELVTSDGKVMSEASLHRHDHAHHRALTNLTPFQVIATSFLSPWKLAQGMNYGASMVGPEDADNWL